MFRCTAVWAVNAKIWNKRCILFGELRYLTPQDNAHKMYFVTSFTRIPASIADVSHLENGGPVMDILYERLMTAARHTQSERQQRRNLVCRDNHQRNSTASIFLAGPWSIVDDKHKVCSSSTLEMDLEKNQTYRDIFPQMCPAPSARSLSNLNQALSKFQVTFSPFRYISNQFSQTYF